MPDSIPNNLSNQETDLMILVYDPVSRLPKFTVDAPWPDTTPQLYTDMGLSWFILQKINIGDKFVVDNEDGTKQLMVRPEFPGTWNKTNIVANGIDEAILTTDIDSFKVYVDGTYVGEITDHTFELSVETHGSYEVSIVALPYMNYSKTITAVYP